MAISFDIKERFAAVVDAVNPFDSEGRRRRSFDRLVTKVVSKNMQHDDRMFAIQTLCDMDTDESISAVFRRWDLKADKEREDRAEKEFLADALAAKGARIRPFVAAHLDRSPNVTWPLQVLRRVESTEAVVEEICRVLAKEATGISFQATKKVNLLHFLEEFDDPRITGAVAPFLADLDETVRFAAVGVLGKRGDETAAAALLARLVSDDEDSNRVKSAILGEIADRGWDIKSQPIDAIRKAVQGIEGFTVSPKGITRG